MLDNLPSSDSLSGITLSRIEPTTTMDCTTSISHLLLSSISVLFHSFHDSRILISSARAWHKRTLHPDFAYIDLAYNPLPPVYLPPCPCPQFLCFPARLCVLRSICILHLCLVVYPKLVLTPTFEQPCIIRRVYVSLTNDQARGLPVVDDRNLARVFGRCLVD